MAARLKLQPNAAKLTFIYNVSQHVGFKQPNLPDDVQLVQFLLREIMAKTKPELAPLGFPDPNGKFDSKTGFWIFLWQQFAKRPVVDGIVSPAKGVQYSAAGVWVIVDLNATFRTNFPAEFEKLHENAALSPSLRSSIKP